MRNLFRNMSHCTNGDGAEGTGRGRNARRLSGTGMLLIGIVIGALLFGSGSVIAQAVYTALPTTSRVFVDGGEIFAEAFLIEEANYFKLRDVARALDIGVWYDEDRDHVYIETDIGYDPRYTGVREEATNVIGLKRSLTVDVDNKKSFDLGESATQGYSASFTIVEIIRGEEAAEIIKTASAHNPSAGIGKEFILAWVRAKITDSKDNKSVVLSDIRVNMHCYSTDGVIYPVSNPSNINPINEQPREIGDSVEGWIAFAVNRNDHEPRIQFGTLAGDEELAWFALYN
ncbi:MAG: hypothetical protein FWH01_05755 [Oscillospiraceae bacterium]|nr:hypothetical protein [Oscillospiraceae bacterium]